MGVLSCMKYLMFTFNVLVFAGGTCLAGVGVWVAVDPAGFQDVVAAKPVLSVGAYLLLAVGIALSLLGFLGCCGALRRSRPLLLVFFILVSLVFVTQLVGAVLFLVHWKQIQPELFLSELRRNYRGDEGAEVFSAAWNTLMVTDLKTLGMAPASRSCTRGRPGRGRAVPGMGSCRQASCWAGSSARRGALATSTSRAASPPSAGPCRSTSLSLGLAAWPCWASRSSPCSSPFAFITTSTEQDEAQQRQAQGFGNSRRQGRSASSRVRAQLCGAAPITSPSPVSAPAGT
ncbi:tetraspanin-4-like isoform X1 [Ciconia boyciana]|uniref:tetraspanin-4-like isoform X1 n=1 Tax=Ciconia boyciana TaxID=52775 RepID=UPI003BA19453